MSGGSMDYFCYSLERVSEEEIDCEIKELMIDLSNYLHDEEWFTSGDISEKDYEEAKKKFKQKWINKENK